MTTWRQIVANLDEEARREVLAALLAPEEVAPGAYPSQLDAATLDGCAEADILVTQWTRGDGALVKVRIRALTFKDRMLAEQESRVANPKTRELEINPWRLMAEEVARGIVTPKVTVDLVLRWNDAIVRELYDAIHRLSGYAPPLIAAAYERLAGPTPEPSGSAPDGRPAAPGVGASRGAGPDAAQPGPADDAGAQPGNSQPPVGGHATDSPPAV